MAPDTPGFFSQMFDHLWSLQETGSINTFKVDVGKGYQEILIMLYMPHKQYKLSQKKALVKSLEQWLLDHDFHQYSDDITFGGEWLMLQGDYIPLPGGYNSGDL